MATEITTIDEAVNFLRLRGFQINEVDGIYRIRKEGWHRRPYELDAETVIKQAGLIQKRASDQPH